MWRKFGGPSINPVWIDVAVAVMDLTVRLRPVTTRSHQDVHVTLFPVINGSLRHYAITQANTTLYNIRPSSPPKTPAPQWSVRPQLAALQASCRLPLTSIYNACAQHQVVSVSQERFLHQPASHLIILAHHCPLQHLPKILPCGSHHSDPPTPGVIYSPTPTDSTLGDRTIQPFVDLVRAPTITPSQLIAYAYRILTCGSHHSDPPMPGVVYSPTPTDSTLGDRTIQPFVDLMSTFRPPGLCVPLASHFIKLAVPTDASFEI
ncbi:hypothetical protein BDR07DRAFT_1497851 [Suillus spraguei]|nr:hypothetical protein BDR07DRAFT_1497851 [Suillus spraguei]